MSHSCLDWFSARLGGTSEPGRLSEEAMVGGNGDSHSPWGMDWPGTTPSPAFSISPGRQESQEATYGGSPKCQAFSEKLCGLSDLIPLQGWHPLGQHPCQGLEPEEPTSSLCSAFYWSCVLVWIFPRSLSFLFLDGKRRTPDSGCTGELKDPQGLGLARRRYTVSIKSLSFWESNFGTAPGPYTGGSLHMETRLLPALSLLLFSHSVVSSLHPPVLSFSHMDAISKS